MSTFDVCPICNQRKNSMLQLECQHDPCLACASLALVHQKQAKSQTKQSKQQYVCTICGQKTTLDPSTVKQLQEISNTQSNFIQGIRKPTKSRSKTPTKDSPKKETFKKSYPQSADTSSIDILRNVVRSKSKTKKSIQCRVHIQQQVTYYCMDCLENICAECAINGIHKGHKAKTIKRAMIDIQKQYDGLLDKADRAREVQKRQKTELTQSIQKLNEQYLRHKMHLTKQFNSLREAIDTKERQLQSQMEELLDRNVALVKAEIAITEGFIKTTDQFKTSIEKVLKMDQLSILAQFGNLHDELTNNITKPIARRQTNKSLGIRTINLQDSKQLCEQIVRQISSYKSSVNERKNDTETTDVYISNIG